MHVVEIVVVGDDSLQVRKIKGSHGVWSRIAQALPSRSLLRTVLHEDVECLCDECFVSFNF